MNEQPSFAARRAIERFQRSSAETKLAAKAMLQHLDETQRDQIEKLIKALP